MYTIYIHIYGAGWAKLKERYIRSAVYLLGLFLSACWAKLFHKYLRIFVLYNRKSFCMHIIYIHIYVQYMFLYSRGGILSRLVLLIIHCTLYQHLTLVTFTKVTENWIIQYFIQSFIYECAFVGPF